MNNPTIFSMYSTINHYSTFPTKSNLWTTTESFCLAAGLHIFSSLFSVPGTQSKLSRIQGWTQKLPTSYPTNPNFSAVLCRLLIIQWHPLNNGNLLLCLPNISFTWSIQSGQDLSEIQGALLPPNWSEPWFLHSLKVIHTLNLQVIYTII